MICSQCGNKITKGQTLCNTCGAAVSKQRPKGILAIVLSVLLAVSVAANIFLLFGKGDQRIEGKGFSSPEKAITAYVEALREGDVDKMISTFAIESYVECFDFEEYLRKYPIYLPSSIGGSLPDSGAYQAQLNTYSRYSGVFKEIYNGYFALIDIEQSPSIKIPMNEDMDEEIEALAEKLSGDDFNKELSRIKIGDILTEDDLDVDEEVAEYWFDAYSAYLDVEDLQEVAIEVEFDSEEFVLYMTTVKIDGRWFNLFTGGAAGNMHANENEVNITLAGGFLKK